ncbi:MAG: type II toxin-antitoxin system HicB family antitoxin [Synechococcales bacterium]|nr:type II toxin-antitoxin system HicB family antitoxin [Synechococcales bacterium]
MNSNIFTYKDYIGEVSIDQETQSLFGEVLHIRDTITFQGETVREAFEAFKDSVEDYLEFCKELGKEPDKPFSGRVPFRTTPEKHKELAIISKKEGKSINALLAEAIDSYLNTHQLAA